MGLFLIFAALAELLLNRVALRLVSGSIARPAWVQAVDAGGLFFFYLTGLLALGLFTWSVLVLIRDNDLFGLPERVVLAALTALFLPMAAASLIMGLPSVVAAHLNTSFMLVTAALTFGFLRRPASLRAKLGLVYLVVPLLLLGYWRMVQQIPDLAPSGRLAELPNKVFVASENLAVLGALAMFLFFAPLPRRAALTSPLPLGVATAVCAAVAVITHTHYGTMTRVVFFGLGFNLPPMSLNALLHLGALFFFVVTIVSLVMRSGPSRELGLGLGLVAVSGFHLQLPYQLLLTLVGLITVIRASMELRTGQRSLGAGDRPGRGCTAGQWRAYLEHLGRTCSDEPDSSEAVIVATEEHRIAHVRGLREGRPFNFRFVQSGSEIEQLDLALGEPGRDPAPAAILRRKGSRGRRIWRRGGGRRVLTGDAAFDREFAVHDRTGSMAGLLQESEIRQQMSGRNHGLIAVWPGEGVRYTTRPGAEGWPVPVAEVAFDPEGADISELQGLLELALRMWDQLEPVTS